MCRTETGIALRSQIFGDRFGYNLLLTVLPFAVLYAIVAVIHFGFGAVLVHKRNTVPGAAPGEVKAPS